jgi:hypothetical protein
MNLSFTVQGKHRSKMIEFAISRLLVFRGAKVGQPIANFFAICKHNQINQRD